MLGAVLAAPPAWSDTPPPSPPRRVIFLDSYGRDFSPYGAMAALVRRNLTGRYARPVEFVHVALQTYGLEPIDDASLTTYIRALCARRRPDLVVTNGGPALRFFKAHQEALLPGTPAVHAGPERRFLSGLSLGPLDTVIAVDLDIRVPIEHVLAIRPETREVAVVFGDSPVERFWAARFRSEWAAYEPRVRLTFLDGLPFDEILRRAKGLQPLSAVFFGLMMTDAAGIPHLHESALERLVREADVPVFGWATPSLGTGIVGGPLLSVERVAGETAQAAGRILDGEPPAAIRVEPIPFGAPVYDARALERFGIDEALLPAGSEVRFREPTFFQAYRGRILAALAVIVVQALAIGALAAGRRRQRRAEEEAARLRGQVAHAGRVSVLGELSSSIAHELSQPLGAILRNAEAAELHLARPSPDLDELRAIVADVKADDRRARDVIDRMRAFLRRHEVSRIPVGPATLVDGVVALVGSDARVRGVSVATDVERDLPAVRVDPVQIQQVFLNLVVNAMEAMDSLPREERALTVAARRDGRGGVEIAVEDRGPGIPTSDRERVFEPFHTTKPHGMGMGLPICRSIVEAHGGTIAVAKGDARGATIVVTLPVEREGGSPGERAGARRPLRPSGTFPALS